MLCCVVLEAGCREDWIEEDGGEGSVEKSVEPPIARGRRTRGLPVPLLLIFELR